MRLLTEYHLEFLSLTEGCTGWSETTLVRVPHCWKSHVAAHFMFVDQSFNCSYMLIGPEKNYIMLQRGDHTVHTGLKSTWIYRTVLKSP